VVAEFAPSLGLRIGIAISLTVTPHRPPPWRRLLALPRAARGAPAPIGLDRL